MVRFQQFGNAGADDERDARGTHTLLLGADDKGIELHTLAPNVFIGGGGAPVLVTYGQFASLLLDSVARLPEVGGPASGKRLGTHRCSDTTLARWWSTALAVVSRLDEAQQLELWSAKQRGAFVLALRRLRNRATPAELAAFYLFDADLELISGHATVPPVGETGVDTWFQHAEWQRGGLADEYDGSLHVAALSEYFSAGLYCWSHRWVKRTLFRICGAGRHATDGPGDWAHDGDLDAGARRHQGHEGCRIPGRLQLAAAAQPLERHRGGADR